MSAAGLIITLQSVSGLLAGQEGDLILKVANPSHREYQRVAIRLRPAPDLTLIDEPGIRIPRLASGAVATQKIRVKASTAGSISLEVEGTFLAAGRVAKARELFNLDVQEPRVIPSPQPKPVRVRDRAVTDWTGEYLDFGPRIGRELIEQLDKGNVVLFCGAGISASEGGLPSGEQLARELAERGGLSELAAAPLPEVAQAYELKMGHQSLIDRVTTRIDDPRFSPLRTHHLIAALPIKRIITTNWDNLLEEALRQAGVPLVKVVRDTDVAYMDEEKVLLIKLHGSVEQKDSIVITGDDYYDVFYRLPQVTKVVGSFFATKTLLFLGFGLADEDFRRLYHEMEHHLGKHKRRAYAVQRNPTNLMVKYWERRNVQVIAADVTAFLKALARQLTQR